MHSMDCCHHDSGCILIHHAIRLCTCSTLSYSYYTCVCCLPASPISAMLHLLHHHHHDLSVTTTGRAAAAGSCPDCHCPGQSCARPFHSRCLLEWLQALPDSTRCFDTLFGACPFCGTAISVKAR
jgi:hypothetical protein